MSLKRQSYVHLSRISSKALRDKSLFLLTLSRLFLLCMKNRGDTKRYPSEFGYLALHFVFCCFAYLLLLSHNFMSDLRSEPSAQKGTNQVNPAMHERTSLKC